MIKSIVARCRAGWTGTRERWQTLFLSGSCIRVAPGSDHWLTAAALERPQGSPFT
jgi:hypothetical protein